MDKVSALIRSYRNDDLPKIAVTVDLLTTGIDVPKITNLVFLRRVNSRILYEQMLGRATRRCDEIGKETFRIFDAVDLYPHLQNLTDMSPVVVNPSISFAQLFEELAKVEDEAHRAEIRDQIVVKLRRRLQQAHRRGAQPVRGQRGRDARGDAEAADRRAAGGQRRLGHATKPGLGPILDWDPEGGGPVYIPISTHGDQVVAVTRGYGSADKPEDFLDGFTSFVRNNVNKIAALERRGAAPARADPRATARAASGARQARLFGCQPAPRLAGRQERGDRRLDHRLRPPGRPRRRR